MTYGVVDKDVSQNHGSEIFLQTYQGLLRQKEIIDRELMKVQGKILDVFLSGKKFPVQKKLSKKKYVPRLKNEMTLAQAIRKGMPPNKPMSTEEIMDILIKKNLYHTQSDSFYTMVNNKVHLDPHIETVSRGVFVYRP